LHFEQVRTISQLDLYFLFRENRSACGALNTTTKKIGVVIRKTTSFLVSHKDQRTAATPINIFFLTLEWKLFSQEPNMELIEDGGLNPKVRVTPAEPLLKK
jgi:hypothetical protein